MKKIILIFPLLVFSSLFCFADENFKGRKETYIYKTEDGISYSDEEFFFVNNFIIHPLNFAGRKDIVFFGKDDNGYHYAFGEYYPSYIGYGKFSGAAYGVGDSPLVDEVKSEEILYSKTDFYKILSGEFYRWYLNKEAFSSDFDCLEDFIDILENFSKEDLRILRNTIYAKYGYKFSSKDLNEIFSAMEWYTPKEKFNDDFTRLDRSLLNAIKLAEK